MAKRVGNAYTLQFSGVQNAWLYDHSGMLFIYDGNQSICIEPDFALALLDFLKETESDILNHASPREEE